MAVQLPNTNTMVSHGLLIKAAGDVVGAITNWGPKQNRNATPVFEFGSGIGSTTVGGGDDIPAEPGEAYEIVPGNIGGTTISIRRYDLFSKRFENAFGTNNLMMLTRQASSIKLIEFWKSPDGSFDFTYVYYGAWFTSIGREHDAGGNRIVMANGEAMYTRRREYAGQNG